MQSALRVQFLVGSDLVSDQMIAARCSCSGQRVQVAFLQRSFWQHRKRVGRLWGFWGLGLGLGLELDFEPGRVGRETFGADWKREDGG